MADLSDIEDALVGLVVEATYPGGPGSPCVVPGIAELNAYRGWPDAPTEDASLAAGVVNATVYSVPGAARNLTRYLSEFREASRAPVTLTVTVAGNTATFGGTGGSGQIVAVLLNGQVNGVQASALPEDVASALAAIVPGASASGAVLTVPAAADFEVRVGAPITLAREVRRQSQIFRITLWCPTPELRDAAATVIDGALADYDGLFIPLRDGTSGLVAYHGTFPDDTGQKSGIYRRDLRYSVEYATMQTRAVSPILFPRASVTLAA